MSGPCHIICIFFEIVQSAFSFSVYLQQSGSLYPGMDRLLWLLDPIDMEFFEKQFKFFEPSGIYIRIRN